MSKEKERGKKNGVLQQLRAGIPAVSPAKKKVLDVLVILNKHGYRCPFPFNILPPKSNLTRLCCRERHSAYQLVTVDGTALSSNLVLEEAPSKDKVDDKKKKSKKDSKAKKKDHKKKASKSKGTPQPAAPPIPPLTVSYLLLQRAMMRLMKRRMAWCVLWQRVNCLYCAFL